MRGRIASGPEFQCYRFHPHRRRLKTLRQECILEASSDKELVLQAATALTGDRAKALTWYLTEPLSPFDGKTAEALVREGAAADVIRLIHSFSAGALG